MSEPIDFVSAYKWDNYCQIIYDRIQKNISHMEWELGELYDQHPSDTLTLLYYYQKWHYNKELFQLTQKEAITRKYVIKNMLQRGYGVNIDLANAFEGFEWGKIPEINKKLGETFYKKISSVQSIIFMPQEHIYNYNSTYIISELCKKLSRPPESNIPFLPPPCPEELKFSLFFDVKNRVPQNVTGAVFQKMFLTLGETSKTIMKGTIGYENFYSPQYLKKVANNNLKNLFSVISNTSPESLAINLDFLKKIHYILYRDLHSPYTCRPGEFRTFDFDDKNGVTVTEEKLSKELMVLEGYLQKMEWNTPDLYKLVRGLSEIYHLIIAIHPFSDANGRVGKCFFNYILMVKGLMPLIFDDSEEILSLPRYGSSLIDIEAYFKNRIDYSINYYVKEIEKIERFEKLDRVIYNVDFDSGFHFRHYGGEPPLVEINFTAYIIPDAFTAEDYMEQCRIVFPDEHSLYSMIIYCGLSRDYTVWEKEICLASPDIMETGGKVRSFDITFFLTLQGEEVEYNFLEISLVSPVTGHVFNNKNLNYCYEILR